MRRLLPAWTEIPEDFRRSNAHDVNIPEMTAAERKAVRNITANSKCITMKYFPKITCFICFSAFGFMLGIAAMNIIWVRDGEWPLYIFGAGSQLFCGICAGNWLKTA
jgi:hypothetical protein